MKSFFLFFTLLLTISWARNSGLNLVLLPDTINGFKDAFFNHMRDRLLTYPINDILISGYQLRDIKMLEFNQLPADFKLDMHDGLISVDADNFAFKASMIAERVNSFKEPLEVWGDSSQITFDLTPTLDAATGLLTYTVSDVVVSLDNLACKANNAQLQTTATGLLNSGDFETSLEEKLAASLQSGLTTSINDFASQARSSVPVARMPFSVSTMMTRAPALNSDYMTLFFDGTIFPTSTGYVVPQIPEGAVLPEVHPTEDKGAQMFVSDYVWNSLLYYMWINSMLEVVLTDNKLPFGSTLRLTTESMESVFPGLIATYGVGQPLSLHCMDLGGSAPTIASQDDMIKGSIVGFCDLYATQGTWKRALTFHGNADFTGRIAASNSELAYQIESMTFNNINVQDSSIGALDNALVQTNLNNAVALWLPIHQGMPVPLIPQGQMVDPIVRSHDGFTEILFDLVFQPATGNPDFSQLLGALGY
jgi:hypothetical protein